MSATAAICRFNLICVIFFQRLTIPLGGDAAVSIVLPICLASLLYLLASNRAFVDAYRLIAASVFLLAATLSQFFNDFSIASLMLLWLIYISLAIRIRLSDEEYVGLLNFFVKIMMVVTFAAITQMLLQVSIGYFPVLEDVIPGRVIAKDFNYIQEISYGTGLFKPNGIVMLEASFLSQFVALALVVEYVQFNRPGRLLLLTFALALSFSGTGASLTLIAILAIVVTRGIQRSSLVLLAVFVLVILALAASGYLSVITNRFEEFSRPGSSASLRFILPFERVGAFFADSDLLTILTGYGAGFIDQGTGFAWNPPVKVLVEYGLITWLAYWVYLATLVRSSPLPVLTLLLSFEYLVFGGGALLQPPVIYACMFLAIGLAVSPADVRRPTEHSNFNLSKPVSGSETI